MSQPQRSFGCSGHGKINAKDKGFAISRKSFRSVLATLHRLLVLLAPSPHSSTRQHSSRWKSDNSARTLHVSPELLALMKECRKATQFANDADWIFASPVQLGRLPWSYKHVWKMYKRAASAAGVDHLSTHSLRHTYRTWLDSTGAPVGVQQKLMRHADIRTTMNVYGDALTPDLKETSEKIVRLALVTKRVAV